MKTRIWYLIIVVIGVFSVVSCNNAKEEMQSLSLEENFKNCIITPEEDVRNLDFKLIQSSGRALNCGWNDGFADEDGNTTINCDGGTCKVVHYHHSNGTVSHGIGCFGSDGLISNAGLFRE